MRSTPVHQPPARASGLARAGESARNDMINNHNWTINDAGKDCSVTVSTQPTTGIDSTTATGNGSVTTTSGEDPERFIEWGTTSGSYTNECSAGIGGLGNYSCVMTGLTPNTTYYVRAKAINSGGTAYGSETSFTTNDSNTTATGQIRARGNLKWRGHFRVR